MAEVGNMCFYNHNEQIYTDINYLQQTNMNQLVNHNEAADFYAISEELKDAKICEICKTEYLLRYMVDK